MRKIFFTILLSIAGLMFAAAQNIVSVSTTEGSPDEIVTIDFMLRNSDEITAVEVIVPLFEKQVTFVDGSCVLNSERANGHLLDAAVVDGKLKVYIYGFSLSSLMGNDGKLFSFSVKLGKTPASYTLNPSVVLSDAQGASLQATATAGVVKIVAPQIEAITETVDFGHVPIRSQYQRTLILRNSGTAPLEVMGMTISGGEFNMEDTAFTIAAGETRSVKMYFSPTVHCAVEESVTIISNAMNGKAVVRLLADPYSVNELHSSSASGIAGGEVTIELRMNNMEPIVGLQTTFNLPEQLEYVEGSFVASERASAYTASATCKDDKLTLLLYSFDDSAIDGSDGVVATFRLRLAGHSGSYRITPQNTVLSNASLENMVSAVSGDYIRISSPSISGSSELDMGCKPVTEIVKAEYEVRNNGDAQLVINNVVFLSTGYKVTDELPVIVDAYQSAVLNVEYTPTSEGEHSTTMNIYSNDPVNKMISVKVKGLVYEPNNLTFSGENLQNGDYAVSIGLDNYTGIVALQMDIHWMPGMETSNDLLKVSERLGAHSCSLTKLDEDSYRFIAFSFSNREISGNSGKLFDLTFTPNGDVKYKDTRIVVDNVVLSNDNANNYTSQLVLDATASFKNYFVRFVCEGETISETFQSVGSKIVKPQMPERTGYTFAWGDTPEILLENDVTITGEYTANTYKVKYIVDGVEYKTESVVYGTLVVLIEAPVKEGHTFSGWSETPATMPANDIVIEGTFAVNIYAVTYLVDGKEYTTYLVEYGSKVPMPEDPSKEGYIFEGWGEIPETMPAEDIEIEALFGLDTGIYGIPEDKLIDVYTMRGVLLKKQVTLREIGRLPRGMYIVDGRKFFVK